MYGLSKVALTKIWQLSFAVLSASLCFMVNCYFCSRPKFEVSIIFNCSSELFSHVSSVNCVGMALFLCLVF